MKFNAIKRPVEYIKNVTLPYYAAIFTEGTAAVDRYFKVDASRVHIIEFQYENDEELISYTKRPHNGYESCIEDHFFSKSVESGEEEWEQALEKFKKIEIAT